MDRGGEGGVVRVVGGGDGGGREVRPLGEEVDVGFRLVPFAGWRAGCVWRFFGQGSGRGGRAAGGRWVSAAFGLLLAGTLGGLGEGFDAARDDVRFAVAGGFFEEEDLVEEFFDCFGEAVSGLLERIAYVEGLQAREHLCQESFLV